MRINVSTLFQVLVLIVQDVLAFEKQFTSSPDQNLPSAAGGATDVTTPVAPQNLDTPDNQSVVTH